MIKMQRFLLFAICVSAAHGAKFPVTSVYGQVQVPDVHQSQVPVLQGQVPVHQGQQNVAVTAKPIAIVQQESEVNPDGSYHNVWESENGIKVQEEGTVKVVAKDAVVQTVSGRFAYTDNDGNPFVLSYTADENGFHPQGDHLPVAPPVPHAIARALEYIAAHPYVEKKPSNAHNTVFVEVN